MGKYVLCLLSVLMILFQAQCAYAGEFNVYSPNAYRQLQKLKEPISMKSNSRMRTQLLVDYSGSMTKWIKIAIDTLEYVLPDMSSRYSIGLRTFSGRDNSGTCKNACERSTLVAGFARNNGQTIIDEMKNLKVGGNTPIEFALRTTVEEDFAPANLFDRDPNAIKTKKIILVTDGFESCGGDPCKYIRELMQERGDIVIDVIQLGGSDRLACLADESGGRHYMVNRDLEIFESAIEQAFQLPDGAINASRTIEDNTYAERTPHYEPKKPLAKNYKFVSE